MIVYLSIIHSMTGVKAYVAGRIKVRGDLVLAQRLEEVFEKAGGREVSILFVVMYYMYSFYLACHRIYEKQ
jgi:succinate dehydrogenase/fumarate reductase cytochrome b subunit